MKDIELREEVAGVQERLHRAEMQLILNTPGKMEIDDAHQKLRLLMEHFGLEFVSGTFIKKIGGK